MAGELKAETARRLFEAFARRKGILAPDVSPLLAAVSTGTSIRPG